MEPEGERLDAGMKGDEGEREGRRPKEKMLYRSAAEHPFLEGLPDGWMLEAVPRGAGTKHVDHYWLVPPDRITGKTKRLRSMNEVRAFLDPEKAVYERAKRIDHEKDVIKKMLDNLIAKVEKRCGEKRSAGTGGGGPGGYRRAIPTRTAADIMREPLTAFMLFSLEQHMNSPPDTSADPRDFVRGYGEAWLALSAEGRLPYEQMAMTCEPKRVAEHKTKSEAKRKALASKARATEIHVKTDEDELAEAAAAAQPGSGRYAPGYSGRGSGRGRGRGRGRGSGKRSADWEDSGGKKSKTNAYAPQYSGSAARRAAKASDEALARSPPPPQPAFGDGPDRPASEGAVEGA